MLRKATLSFSARTQKACANKIAPDQTALTAAWLICLKIRLLFITIKDIILDTCTENDGITEVKGKFNNYSGFHVRVKWGKFRHPINSDTHLQTVIILMRRLLMSRLIRIFTVCLGNLFFFQYLKYETNKVVVRI